MIAGRSRSDVGDDVIDGLDDRTCGQNATFRIVETEVLEFAVGALNRRREQSPPWSGNVGTRGSRSRD